MYVRKAFVSQSQYNCVNICTLFPVASLMITVFCRNMYLIHELTAYCYILTELCLSLCSFYFHPMPPIVRKNFWTE